MAVVAVDIGGTKLLVSVVSTDGEIILKILKNTPKTVTEIVDLIIGLTEKAVSQTGKKVSGIGLAVAGLVDYGSGIIVSSPNLPLTAVNLRDLIGARIGLPVYIDNDGNLAAMGEKVKGAAGDLDDFIVLTLGTGIGGGIFIGGRLYRGAFGTAGEIGHMVIAADGPKCNCGRRGCFEAMASGTAVARMAAEVSVQKPGSALAARLNKEQAGSSGLIVEELARSGDTDAVNIFQRAGRALGIGMGNLVNILSPQGIILGGGMSKAADLFLSTARFAMLETTIDPRADRVSIEVSSLGHDAGLFGAAAMAGLKLPGM